MKVSVRDEHGVEIWTGEMLGPLPKAIEMPAIIAPGVFGQRVYQRVAVNDDDGAVYA